MYKKMFIMNKKCKRTILVFYLITRLKVFLIQAKVVTS